MRTNACAKVEKISITSNAMYDFFFVLPAFHLVRITKNTYLCLTYINIYDYEANNDCCPERRYCGMWWHKEE